MARYLLFVLWLVVTLAFVALASAEFLFSPASVKDAKLLGVRILLALVWPIAIMSESGRRILTTTVKGDL